MMARIKSGHIPRICSLAIATVLLLSACAGEKPPETSAPPEAMATATPTQTPTPTAAQLPKPSQTTEPAASPAPTAEPTQAPNAPQISGLEWDENALCAVGFFGYGPLYGGMFGTMQPLFAVYSELYSQMYYQDYVFGDGDERYFIVPRYADATVEIRTQTMENGVGEVVFEGDATPFLVACNPSDLYSNVVITITGNGESVVFSPQISLVDGALALPADGTVQDITVQNDVNENLIGVWTSYGYAYDRNLDEDAEFMFLLHFFDDGDFEYVRYTQGEVFEWFYGTAHQVVGASMESDGEWLYHIEMTQGDIIDPYWDTSRTGRFIINWGDNNETINIVYLEGDTLDESFYTDEVYTFVWAEAMG